MKSKLTKLIPALILPAIFGLSLAAVPSTYADDVCSNDHVSDEIKAASGCGGNANQLPDVISDILNVIIGIAGLISVIFIVVGGIQYITSSGDAAKIKKAKDTILYACIGLIVCALAFAIVNFVIMSILKQSAGTS